MLLARHLVLMARDLTMSAARSGLWWVPIVVPVLAVAALVIALAKVAVPTVVYVFF
jgi:hypothetical protein